MSNNKKIIYLIMFIFVILVGVVVGIFNFALNITSFTTYPNGTSIANVYVSGLYGSQAQSELNTNISEWQTNATIDLVYQGYEIEVDNSKFNFHVNLSIDSIRNGYDNRLFVNLEKDYVKGLLEENETTIKYNDYDIEKLERDLINKASRLYQDVEIDLGSYMVNLDENKSVLNTTTLSGINNPHDFSVKFNSLVNQVEIKGKKQFSLLQLNETLYKEQYGKFTDYELSIIATAMYELILETNFQNIQKSITPKIADYPRYALDKQGFEANVNQELGNDFTFYNPNYMAYFVKATYDSATKSIQFQLLGAPFINTIEVIGVGTDEIAVMEPKDLVIYKEEVNGVPVPLEGRIYDQENHTGIPGFRVLVTRKITDTKSNVHYELIYEDIYMPRHTLITKHPDGRNVQVTK